MREADCAVHTMTEVRNGETMTCIICQARPSAKDNEDFCRFCAVELANDLVEVYGFAGPLIRSIERSENYTRYDRPEPTWGIGCTAACGYCGACT